MAKKNNDALLYAILGLIINWIIPGVATIVWGNRKHGIIQLILYIVGIVLSFVLIGIPLVMAAWIWALVSSIQMIIAASK